MTKFRSLPSRTITPICAALAVIVALGSLTAAPASAPGPAVVPSPQHMDISRDWRLKPDPGNIGLREGWAAPSYDDRGWARVDAGRSWEEQGFADYNGYAWYRRTVNVPAGWRGMPLYLWLSGIDDECDIFVNGVLVAHFGDLASKQPMNNEQVRVDIGGFVKPASAVSLAVRVYDWGGFGGIAALPAAVATSGYRLFQDDRLVKYWFNREPDLPWPYWLRSNKGNVKQQGAAWTMVGTEGGTAKSLLGLDSSVMPSQNGPVLTPWVFDHAAQRLHVPQPPGVTFTLAEGHLPLPTAQWAAPGLSISSTLLVAGPSQIASAAEASTADIPPTAQSIGSDGDVAFYAVSIANNDSATRDLSLLLALRPYSVAGRLTHIYSLAQAGPAVLVNGGVGLVADRPPDGFGAVSLDSGDIGFFAKDGKLPPAPSAQDSRGLASGALSYRFLLQPGDSATFTFKLPVAPSGDRASIERLHNLGMDTQRQAVLRYWRNRLGSIQLALPDDRFSNAYYASLANLLTARNGDLFLPGPLIHRRFWYRDSAYLSLALLRAGRGDLVQPMLSRVIAGQLPSGEFPPILEPDGRVADLSRHEWDAQGEGIFALVGYYRWTQDTAWLRQAYPTIRRAALFLKELRAGQQKPTLIGSPAYGILPPSESAEDLGPAEWHHYWDDFWALTGLREAAAAARALGEDGDVRWLEAEEGQLRANLLESIRLIQQEKGIDYVPNGPEDTDTSAMARGTTPALWPGASFDPNEGFLRDSFAFYFQRWLAPYGGAYRHESNNYWPYGGLQLAHVYLLLGMPDKVQAILDWTLANQTFPGVYAWAESVSPATNLFAGGDMPHAWAAAEYVLLLRDMLLREDGNRLILASYLPPAWFADGQRVAVAGMPTLFGPAGYALESHAAAGYWDLAITPGANPPDGFLLHLPDTMVVQKVVVDGNEWTQFDASGVRLPPKSRLIRLYGHLPIP